MTVTRTHTLGRHSQVADSAFIDLAEAARSGAAGPGPVRVTINGHTALVPAEIAGAFGDVLDAFADRQGVVIGALDADVTTGAAARFLGISRTYLCTLVDDGVIPCHYVGTHRRIATRDLLDYAERRRNERRAALDELTRVSAKAGLYDGDF